LKPLTKKVSKTQILHIVHMPAIEKTKEIHTYMKKFLG